MSAAWQDARANIAAHPLAWPAARLLRRIAPSLDVPGLGVVVSDATLGHEVLSRDRDFVKNGAGSIASVVTQAFGPSALANMDGEAHRQFRQRLGTLADPAHAEAWLAEAEAPFSAALTELRAGETVDFASVAQTLSGRLTLALLGAIPDAPRDRQDAAARDVHALGERIAGALQLSPLGGSKLARVQRDHARLIAYAAQAFAREDLPPASLVARLKRLGCSEEQTRGVLSIFFVAGALTLGTAIPRLIALLIDSGELRTLRANPDSINTAVDEGMRFICPIPATVRIAGCDTALGGHRIARGRRIIVLTANCARDDALFPDGDRFDVRRRHDPRARYLWYGAGPHFCLGFALAQRTLRHVIAGVAALPESLRVVRRTAARRVLLPAWTELQVRLERAS